MNSRRIIVDSETFWQIFANLDGFILAFGDKEEKGYFKNIPVYIKNV